jgi:hypothetical protein
MSYMSPIVICFLVSIISHSKKLKNLHILRKRVFEFNCPTSFVCFLTTEFRSIKGLPPNESHKSPPQVPLNKCRVRWGVKYFALKGPTIKQLRANWGPPATNLYDLDVQRHYVLKLHIYKCMSFLLEINVLILSYLILFSDSLLTYIILNF